LKGGIPYGAVFLYNSATNLTNITISGLTIDTQNVATASGIQLSNVSNSTISNVVFTNGAANGWHLYFGAYGNAGTAVVQNFYNTVTGVDFLNHTGTLEAFLLFNSQYTAISNVTLTNVSSPGIGLWQKDYDTTIANVTCTNSPTVGGVIYYSITVERTAISDLQTTNCGPAIRGSNISDYGTYGLTQAQNLTITNPVLVGGPNSATQVGIQLGAVNNATIQNAQISLYEIGILLNNGWAGAGLGSPTNWAIVGGVLKDNDATNDYQLIHPAILISGTGGREYGVIQGVQIYDDQVTHNQRYPIVFDGAASFNNISITGNMLSPANGGSSIAVGDGARIGASTQIWCNTNYIGSNPLQTNTSCN
jgi:hypothetical protein